MECKALERFLRPGDLRPIFHPWKLKRHLQLNVSTESYKKCNHIQIMSLSVQLLQLLTIQQLVLLRHLIYPRSNNRTTLLTISQCKITASIITKEDIITNNNNNISSSSTHQILVILLRLTAIRTILRHGVPWQLVAHNRPRVNLHCIRVPNFNTSSHHWMELRPLARKWLIKHKRMLWM